MLLSLFADAEPFADTPVGVLIAALVVAASAITTLTTRGLDGLVRYRWARYQLRGRHATDDGYIKLLEQLQKRCDHLESALEDVRARNRQLEGVNRKLRRRLNRIEDEQARRPPALPE